MSFSLRTTFVLFFTNFVTQCLSTSTQLKTQLALNIKNCSEWCLESCYVTGKQTACRVDTVFPSFASILFCFCTSFLSSVLFKIILSLFLFLTFSISHYFFLFFFRDFYFRRGGTPTVVFSTALECLWNQHKYFLWDRATGAWSWKTHLRVIPSLRFRETLYIPLWNWKRLFINIKWQQ